MINEFRFPEYHKIQSVFLRDTTTNNKRFLVGEYSIPEFKLLENIEWQATEKVDGTNIRISTQRIAGKTNNAQILASLYPVLELIQQHMKESNLPDSTILYGEGYGAKIQSGGNYIPDGQSFALFDVNICGNWQSRSNIERIGTDLGITICPVLGCKPLIEWVHDIQSGKHRQSILHPSAKNEGLILRPSLELQTRDGKRIITKIKFKDFGL